MVSGQLQESIGGSTHTSTWLSMSGGLHSVKISAFFTPPFGILHLAFGIQRLRSYFDVAQHERRAAFGENFSILHSPIWHSAFNKSGGLGSQELALTSISYFLPPALAPSLSLEYCMVLMTELQLFSFVKNGDVRASA